MTTTNITQNSLDVKHQLTTGLGAVPTPVNTIQNCYFLVRRRPADYDDDDDGDDDLFDFNWI